MPGSADSSTDNYHQGLELWSIYHSWKLWWSQIPTGPWNYVHLLIYPHSMMGLSIPLTGRSELDEMRRYYWHPLLFLPHLAGIQLRDPVFNPAQASSPRRAAKKLFSSLGAICTFRSLSSSGSISSGLGLEAGYTKCRIYKPRSFFCTMRCKYLTPSSL